MTESEWHGRVNFGRLQEYFGRVNFGRLREYFGRVTLADSDNTLVESPWLNTRILGRVPLAEYENTWPSPLGRILEYLAESDYDNCWMTLAESEWSGRIALADSEWLNPKPWLLQSEISYTNRHQLVLGAPDSSAHAWEKTVSAGPCVRLIWACRDDTSWAEVAWLWVSRGEAVCRP